MSHKTRNVSLPSNVAERLAVEAKRQDRPASRIVVEALKKLFGMQSQRGKNRGPK